MIKLDRVLFRITLFVCLSLVFFFSPVPKMQAASNQVSTSLKSIALQGEKACLQPPTNVNLATLSDSALVSYGFPPHSVIDKNLSKWSTNFSHVKYRICGSSPSKDAYQHRHQMNNSSCTIGNRCDAPGWAGNVGSGSRGTFRSAQVIFTVPYIDTSNCSAHVSIWAGVGGDSGSTSGGVVLVQTGVDISVDALGFQYNKSWWEVADALPEQNLPLKRLAIGDTIFAEADSNINNNGTDFFYIENESDGSYDSNSLFDNTPSHFSDSGTGECIVERNFNNSTNSLNPLAYFGTEQLTNCILWKEGDDHYTPIENVPHFYYQITNSSGNVLASVGHITNGTDYPVIWHAWS